MLSRLYAKFIRRSQMPNGRVNIVSISDLSSDLSTVTIMRAKLRHQLSYDRLRFDRSRGVLSLTTTVFRWAIVVSVVMWVVMGLVSLRFDLSGNFLDILYSQLIIAGIIALAIANIYITDMGGFGSHRGYKVSILAPILSGSSASIGLLLLLWYVWTDFNVGPNELMKVTYSLLGLGLCGTFAGLVTLASIPRNLRVLQWATYLLTAIVAGETLDALWSVKVLSIETAGREFAVVGIVVAITFGVYMILGLIARGASSEKARMYNLYIYTILGLIGYGIALFYLWDNLDAGPVRFVYGASVVLTIVAVAIALLHYYVQNPLIYRPSADDMTDRSPFETAEPSTEDG